MTATLQPAESDYCLGTLRWVRPAARLAAIKQDILANITDPNLSVSNVAARQALSPRYIHKLFEQEGASFSAFVVAERLKQAYRMLNDPRCLKRPIGVIAFDAGFGDLSYFNRTFKRRFGATPSEMRATPAWRSEGCARTGPDD